MGGDLPAQLAADRAAAPRHEDDFVLDITHDFVQIDLDLLPAQKVLYLHLAQFGNGDLPVRELIDAGQDFDGTLAVLAAVDDGALDLFVGGGHRDEDLFHSVSFGEPDDVVGRARDAHPRDEFSLLGRVVVRDADGFIVDLVGSEHLLDEGESGAAAAHDHHPLFLLAAARKIIPQNDENALGKTGAAGKSEQKNAEHDRRADIRDPPLRKRCGDQIEPRRAKDGQTEFERVDDPHRGEHDVVHSEQHKQRQHRNDVAYGPAEKHRRRRQSPARHDQAGEQSRQKHGYRIRRHQ